MLVDLTEVFRPWVLVALALAVLPFAIVLVRKMTAAHGRS